MAIPGITYTVTLKGAAYKFVRCEKCSVEFAYRLEREAIQSSNSVLGLENQTARERATAAAEASLQNQLAKAIDPVPCPTCGWYQADMVPVIRRLHQMWMNYAGLPLLGLGVLFTVFYFGASSNPDAANQASAVWYRWIAAVAGPAGLALMLLRTALASRLRPNDGDVEERKRQGKERAIPAKELEEIKLVAAALAVLFRPGGPARERP